MNETEGSSEPEESKPVIKLRPEPSEKSTGVVGYEPKELKEVFEDIIAFINKPPDRVYEEINFKLGLAGGIMAIVGVFCPAFNVMSMVNVSLINVPNIITKMEGPEAGVGELTFFVYLTIAIGVCGIVCSSKKLYHMNLIFGGISLCIYLILFIGFKKEIQDAEGFVNLSWGWVVLITSSICLILSRTYKSKDAEQSE